LATGWVTEVEDDSDVNRSRPGAAPGRARHGWGGRLAGWLGWNKTSYLLMSVFAATVFLIIVVWWPLAEEYLATANPNYPLWMQLDWLLIGVFAAMSLLIMARPDLKADTRIVLIGLAGGLVIESWGTQTSLWTYYTHERPPLWIIPAWPIASLAIDRLYRLLRAVFGGRLEPPQLNAQTLTTQGVTEAPDFGRARVRRPREGGEGWAGIYWLIFGCFAALMVVFVWPTLDKSLTIAALALCALLIATPTDYRGAVLTFVAGAGLGYFLELWGTTRLCWTYYTLEMPPTFAVLAHGMAAVAFWRVGLVAQRLKVPGGVWRMAGGRGPNPPTPFPEREGGA
jgi:hypothetical protein